MRENRGKKNKVRKAFFYILLISGMLSVLIGLYCVPVSAAQAELYWPVRYEDGTSNRSISTHNGENGHKGIDIGNAGGCSWYAPIDGIVERVYTGCVSNGYDTGGHTSCYPQKDGVYYGRTHMSQTIDGIYYEGDYCNNGFGNGVVIQTNIDGRNYYFHFAHMDSVCSTLHAGQSIAKGTYLGKVGDRGFSFGTHAHFAVNVDGVFGTVVNNDPEQPGCQFTYNYETNPGSGIRLWGIDNDSVWNGNAKFWAKRFDDDQNHYAIFYLDDNPLTGYISSDSGGLFSVNVDTTKYANGTHKLSVYYANTAAGFWDIRQIIIDNSNSGNQILLWGIEENSSWSGTAKFWAKRFDGDSNHYAVFYLDDSPLTGNLSSDDSGFFSVTVDTKQFTNGKHKLSILYANTASGNWDVKNIVFDNVMTPTVTPTPKPTPIVTPTPKPSGTQFTDITDSTHPFYNAIYWAADAGITKGYPDGTFGVNRDCTRGEMMMFLWRYVGQPAPKMSSKSPFKDVPTTHAFYKAILWGSQKGITKGYPDGSFGINRNVSRGECMMFLWRLKNKPAPKAVAKTPFPDVPKSHAFYNAILWGYQKKITNGFTSGPLKGKFGINENCSRGQIVTFLYRAK